MISQVKYSLGKSTLSVEAGNSLEDHKKFCCFNIENWFKAAHYNIKNTVFTGDYRKTPIQQIKLMKALLR